MSDSVGKIKNSKWKTLVKRKKGRGGEHKGGREEQWKEAGTVLSPHVYVGLF